MPNQPEDTEPKSWHRYFAIESNNRAWELATVHAIHAHAAAGVGNAEAHRTSYQLYRPIAI